MKNEIFDKMLDNLLDEAIPEYLEKQKYDDAEDVVFSQKHNANMKKIFDDMKQKRKIQKLSIIARRVAVIVVAATVLMVLFSPQMLAWRSKIFDMFIQDHGDYSWTIFEEVEDDGSERDNSTRQLSEEEKEEILSCFGYLPEGFEIDNIWEKNECKNIYFMNFNCYITLRIYTNKSKVAIDTESGEYNKADFSNLVIVKKYEKNRIVWMNQDITYELVSNLDENSLRSVVKNINYSKILKFFN